jgi:threonylcarbamoyladenosine tRNA methylthiotransferase MtaB
MRMGQAVSSATVKKRAGLLHDLGHAKRLAFHNKQIGMTVSALFEAGTQDGYRHGTTPNFTKVAVAASDDLQNQIKPITITAATERWAFGHVVQNQPMNSSVTLL